MTENNFDTTVAYHVTDEGDKILYPFSPPIYQSYVDNKLTKELIEEGRKLTLKDNDHNHKLAGNLKYGRSYHYNDDYISKVEPYLKTYVERFFNSIKSPNLSVFILSLSLFKFLKWFLNIFMCCSFFIV